MIVLGIMNGTSVDGIDYVWSEITGSGKSIKLKFLHQEHKAFNTGLKEQIQLAIGNNLPTHELGLLHHDLGREYAKHYKEFKKVPRAKLIGLHGQTVFHKGKIASLQIGEPSYLAAACGVPVVFNFRAADVASGGEGAPLAPLFHDNLLKKFSSSPVAFHNLGGISNLTYCHKNQIIAFDTGPASTLMDSWVSLKSKGLQGYDKDGKIAEKGLPHLPSLQKMLTAPYLQLKAPKSCGREEFNLDFIKNMTDRKFSSLSLEDQVNTLTEFTAVTILEAYEKFLPKMPEKIFFSGGGTHNPFLMKRLKIFFKTTEVLTSEDLGWPASAIEGGAFALLAYLRINKVKCDLKSITGGSKSALLGQICEL